MIKKGPSHGARYGNTKKQRICHAAHVSAKKAVNRGFKSILDRFLKSPRYREARANIGWDEEHCPRNDAAAADDHSYIAAASERFRRENARVLVSNSSGPNGPMNQREDYHEAMKIKERLCEESGKGNTRLHPSEQVRQRPRQPLAWRDEVLEVVQLEPISQFFFLGMATVFVVAIFFMVTDGVNTSRSSWREVFVELSPEDYQAGCEHVCGLLQYSLYGTRDSAQNGRKSLHRPQVDERERVPMCVERLYQG